MMFSKKCFHGLVIVVVSWVLTLVVNDQGIAGSTFPLDKETVFCIYYKMSGDFMEEQDLEELAFSSGRPAFTVYKPAEMFMKNSLRRLRDMLVKKMRNYGEDSVFKWNFKYTFVPDQSKIERRKSIFRNNQMPQPTPFIRSEMSKEGWRSVHKGLDSLLHKTSKRKEKMVFEITVFLKPEKTDYQFQKRKIALQDVHLPLRRVIFRPVKIGVFPSKHSDQKMLVYEIPDPSTS